MAKRNKLSKRGSRGLFKATVNKTHIMNYARPMRGGVRF